MAKKSEKARMVWHPESNPNDIKYSAWFDVDTAQTLVDFANYRKDGDVHFVEYKPEKQKKNG